MAGKIHTAAKSEKNFVRDGCVGRTAVGVWRDERRHEPRSTLGALSVLVLLEQPDVDRIQGHVRTEWHQPTIGDERAVAAGKSNRLGVRSMLGQEGRRQDGRDDPPGLSLIHI